MEKKTRVGMLVYTFGYQGRDPRELLTLCKRKDAVVVDVRYSPRSRNPRWNRRMLEKVLGERYVWIREFGNKNYATGGRIKLVDFAAGVEKLNGLQYNCCILLCQEADPDKCHRKVVARMLNRQGFVYLGELKGKAR